MRCFALVASLFVASSSLLSTHAAPYQQHAQQQQQQVAFSTSKIDNDIRIIQYADDVDALAVIDERTLIALLDDPRALAANAAAMGIISPPLLAHFQRHADAAYGPGFIDVTAHYPDDLPSREDIRRVRARSHAAMHRIIGGAMSTVRAGTTTADQGHHSAVAVDLPRLLTLIDPARLNATIAHLSTDFRTRHYKSRTAETVPAWIAAEVKAMIKAYGREEDVRVRLVAGKGTPRQSNVIVEMARDDASGNNIDDDELVVIGAHEDSISSRTNYEQAAPGADDDATGIACVMEILRVLLATDFRPRERSIHFMAFAGEEGGLLGSKDVARAYAQEGRTVVGMLQLEMAGYRGRGMVTVLRDTNAPLADFVSTLARTHLNHTSGIATEQATCNYACSDHYSFHSEGFPTVALAEASPHGPQLNPNIHRASDTLAVLDMDFLAQFARVGLAFAVEMSGGGSG